MTTDRMLVWSGVSQLDGRTPVIVLATGLPHAGSKAHSANAKTGDMVQVHILLADTNPTHALKQGQDSAICGTCPHKSVAAGGSGACYTHANIRRGFAQTSTWKAHDSKGSLPFDVERFRGLKVRFGAYGDPAAVPVSVWESIASVAAAVTGYTHQWRTCDPAFARWCMASADTAEEGREARKLGYRNFIVRPVGSAKPKGAVVCPASEEAGKRTVCADCLQCGGTDSGRRADITIMAHGSSARKFLPLTVVAN
jgi:hypothetical protein